MEYGLNAAKLAVGILMLIFILRLLGKKELAQITPYDVVYLLVFGGILEESLYDKKITLLHFIFSISVWAVMIYLIERLAMKFNVFRKLLKGSPDQIIGDGKLNMHLISKNQLDMEQLREMLRRQGIFSLREVKDLYVEPSGEFSINQYAQYKPVTAGDMKLNIPEEDPSVLLIDQGKVKHETLQFIDKTEEWLREQLKEKKYPDLKQILYCEWSKTEGFFIRTRQEIIDKK
ncbi:MULTISPECIES: DUF421 domain-containing protein [Sporosarcina]|uniref:Uncharacterized membrane protein YcaP, DUF421 family n=1 Tax=Sporosarcina newyorkensis TaxID=759851 RepID=A0A1T4YRS3_9BACL|nr:DUF421 domain-containing protein [Sporosarcina newyorkensis]SKB04436.1 Uncharacterized membrane protein YcaP, DUF421 family [Sporosarcina newyorkensis]